MRRPQPQLRKSLRQLLRQARTSLMATGAADAVAITMVRPCWIFSSWESEVVTRDQSAAGRENGGAFRVAVRRHNFFGEHFPGPCLITTCKEPVFCIENHNQKRNLNIMTHKLFSI